MSVPCTIGSGGISVLKTGVGRETLVMVVTRYTVRIKPGNKDKSEGKFDHKVK